jgi:hypothetical protein
VALVSVAYSAPALIRINAEDAVQAGAIVQALVGVFGGGDVSFDADLLQVEVRALGDPQADAVRAVGALEAWLAEAELESVFVEVTGRSYRIAPRSRAERSQNPLTGKE